MSDDEQQDQNEPIKRLVAITREKTTLLIVQRVAARSGRRHRNALYDQLVIQRVSQRSLTEAGRGGAVAVWAMTTVETGAGMDVGADPFMSDASTGAVGHSSRGGRWRCALCAPRGPTSTPTHPGPVSTVKQHLDAIRMLGDWLVVSQVLPVNPAAAGDPFPERGPGGAAAHGPGDRRRVLCSDVDAERPRG